MTNGTNGIASKSLAIIEAEANQVAVYRGWKETDIRQEMAILKEAFPKSLRNQPDAALRALVIAGKASKLSPFRGEIYLIPGVGIQTASKVKAADAIDKAARSGNTLTINFQRIKPGSPQWAKIKEDRELDPGDVVVECEIISSKTRADYFAARLAMITEAKALDSTRTGESIKAEVDAALGPKAPTIKVYGIVRKGENFGGAEAESKFPREDRAQKRALQKALNLGGYAATDQRDYAGLVMEDAPPPDEDTVVEGQWSQAGVHGAAQMDEEPVVSITKPEAPPEPVAAPEAEPVAKDTAPTEKAPEKAQTVKKEDKSVRKGKPSEEIKSESPFGEASDPVAEAMAKIKVASNYIAAHGKTMTISEWRRAVITLSTLAKTVGVDASVVAEFPATSDLMRELEASAAGLLAAIDAAA